MKEKLYTIPLMDAFKADDECPFCFIERQLEQHTMDFVLGAGASYMEDDVRAETDKMGFCRTHYKKIFLTFLKRIRNFCLFLKIVRDFAFLISEILWKPQKPLFLTKKKRPFTIFCFL